MSRLGRSMEAESELVVVEVWGEGVRGVASWCRVSIEGGGMAWNQRAVMAAQLC